MSEFLKNTAGQIVKGHVCNLTTGADETTGVSVAVVIDNGSAAAGSGTLTYKSGDLWHYLPTQAETNGDALSFIFSKAGAKTDTVDIYTTTKRVSALNDIPAGSAMTLTSAYDAAKTAMQAGAAVTLAANQDVRNVGGTLPAVTLAASQPNYAPAKAGDSMVASNFSAAPSASTIRQEIDANSTQLAAIRSKIDNLPADPADASDISSAFSAVNSALGTISNYVDTEVGSIKTVTDKINTALEQDGALWRLTANALEQAPTGGNALSASDIADAVLDEALAGHAAAGTAGAALTAAASGGIDSNALVDAILGALTADHNTEGTVGHALGVFEQIAAMGAGYGDIEKTYTVTKGGLPLSDVTVKARTVNDIAAAPYRWGVTDGNGEVTFRFPASMAGSDIWIWRSKGGERFTDPDREEI